MHKILYNAIILTVFTSGAVFAQTDKGHLNKSELRRVQKYQILRKEENWGYHFQHAFTVGGRLTTNGWSANLEYGRKTSSVTNTLFQLDVGEIKDPKEEKQSIPVSYYDPSGFGYYFTSKPYVYGKENVFYQIRLGIGQQRLIGGKGNKNGVEVSAVYLGGLSLGLVKPYYLELYDSSGNGSSFQKYSATNASLFLNQNDIAGGGGFSRGLNEMSVVPGLYLKGGVRFDWAEFDQFVSALEVGVSAEAYAQKIHIMVENPGQQFFYGAYVSLMFGKRW